MKNISLVTVLSFSFLIWALSCQNPAGKDGSLSGIDNMDLASLKTLLTEKKNEVSQLETEIDSIEQRMETLDPSLKSKKAQRVTVMHVDDTVFSQYITVQGLLEADESVNVNSETGGRLIHLKIDEGDYVKKGELVGKLDLEQLAKQKAELEKGYELAKEVYERQKRLWDQKIGSEIQYLQAKNEKERLDKSLETLEYQQSKADIYAPISGVVDMINIREGELVSPGAPIAVILDIRQLKATADVPENYLSDVHQGDKVTVRFPSLDAETTGRISLIGSTIDKANRTFKVEVQINRFTKNLKPNMLTEIKINTENIKDVVTVPINLIQQEINGKKYLIVVDRTGEYPVAKKVYITPGLSNDSRTIIKDGLSPGDEVVQVGGRTVTEGTPLEIIQYSVLRAGKNEAGR